MTVKELIDTLRGYPQDAKVIIDDINSDFANEALDVEASEDEASEDAPNEEVYITFEGYGR